MGHLVMESKSAECQLGWRPTRSKRIQERQRKISLLNLGSQDIPLINVGGTRSKMDGILKDRFSSSKEVQVLNTQRKFTILINTLKIILFSKRYRQINSEDFETCDLKLSNNSIRIWVINRTESSQSSSGTLGSSHYHHSHLMYLSLLIVVSWLMWMVERSRSKVRRWLRISPIRLSWTSPFSLSKMFSIQSLAWMHIIKMQFSFICFRVARHTFSRRVTRQFFTATRITTMPQVLSSGTRPGLCQKVNTQMGRPRIHHLWSSINSSSHCGDWLRTQLRS